MGRPALLGATTGALLWLTTTRLGPVGSGVAVFVHLLVNSFVFVDMLDFLARLYRVRFRAETDSPGGEAVVPSALTPAQRRLHVQEYAIVVSVHEMGDAVYDLMRALATHRDRVYLVDDASSDHTAARLRHAGWRCLSLARNRKKPGAIRELLQQIPVEIETLVLIDPDIIIENRRADVLSDLEATLYDFQRSGAAAFAPNVTVRPGNLLAALQDFEFALALSLGRASLGRSSVLSGVAVYRRSALEAVLERHSLSVYAEDLESALILLARGEQIYFDDRLQMETDAKSTLVGWFSQRVGWSFGLIKVYFERWPEIRTIARRSPFAAYQYIVYLGGFCILMLPFKLAAIAVLCASLSNGLEQLLGLHWIPDTAWTDPHLFADVYCKYVFFMSLALVFVVAPTRRSRLAPAVLAAFPFYVAAQCIASAVAYANWVGLRLFGRRLYHDHYDQRPRLGGHRSAWFEPEGESA